MDPISFDEHQVAKARARERDQAELEAGLVTAQDLGERNGTLAGFVVPGRIGRVGKRLELGDR